MFQKYLTSNVLSSQCQSREKYLCTFCLVIPVYFSIAGWRYDEAAAEDGDDGHYEGMAQRQPQPRRGKHNLLSVKISRVVIKLLKPP